MVARASGMERRASTASRLRAHAPATGPALVPRRPARRTRRRAARARDARRDRGRDARPALRALATLVRRRLPAADLGGARRGGRQGAVAVAEPVPVSGQHYAWLSPLLETGWFALLSTPDAVCYHDGHRALD